MKKSQLDKSWEKEVDNFTDQYQKDYLSGANDFQNKLIKELEINVVKDAQGIVTKSFNLGLQLGIALTRNLKA